MKKGNSTLWIQWIVRALSWLFSRLLILPVKLYQYLLSPMLPGACRFVPTCSEYTIEALKSRGVFMGMFLSVRRILRCHPFGGHGFDPVPPKGTPFMQSRRTNDEIS